MRKYRLFLALGSILSLIAAIGAAEGRGSIASERPYAAEHIDLLPVDIRHGLARLERPCGGKAAATHYFSTTIDAGGLHFRSLHFEDFACERREAICRAERCLHEVYLERGGRSRRVFSAYVDDMKLINAGGTVALELEGGRPAILRWNGRTFAPVHSFGKGQER
ncbi:hypothetical protein C7U92_16270 [Bradyrhizobium sp. WBOS7]|uniref:Uncharacterized protein n=1 Tax=Bradyrhizobium betae TaxID=244734 RepID=A0AAE9SSD6_9BRAD|nr:hypothetical protein [Bradyrhizobium sp. WBOS2]MDD1572085.1 hypothetical protein [Bradyrhizobium sp. WBOS1]MDD1578276.1 hypothetical protein [Bradyrhizobium sp. WBOS7]MDD1601345.1 hypothetical protein [Bradyrhizobium sp. WBOS16]UUO37108.1 hypothetical protein DCK84_22735 [Bradyrhizobium sp. WBOS01]UUO43411.1 hypothetical protein DCM75_23490 [Bradyrhizobium sp. WBOS02]UUO53343.1 hypothetical protein DCM79_10385 [Bradyrhizobium sp. WBOS07]UUO67347.1 hypothetical protein DCM83_20495 [Bradyrh